MGDCEDEPEEHEIEHYNALLDLHDDFADLIEEFHGTRREYNKFSNIMTKAMRDARSQDTVIRMTNRLPAALQPCLLRNPVLLIVNLLHSLPPQEAQLLHLLVLSFSLHQRQSHHPLITIRHPLSNQPSQPENSDDFKGTDPAAMTLDRTRTTTTTPNNSHPLRPRRWLRGLSHPKESLLAAAAAKIEKVKESNTNQPTLSLASSQFWWVPSGLQLTISEAFPRIVEFSSLPSHLSFEGLVRWTSKALQRVKLPAVNQHGVDRAVERTAERLGDSCGCRKLYYPGQVIIGLSGFK
ncbi:hypothetical protein CPC08DRAFT_726289 [Agrocybe pediades]|nr:hypothetical protein CPC08DRAFT_726289 [Agrocybe pediades]